MVRPITFSLQMYQASQKFSTSDGAVRVPHEIKMHVQGTNKRTFDLLTWWKIDKMSSAGSNMVPVARGPAVAVGLPLCAPRLGCVRACSSSASNSSANVPEVLLRVEM